MIYTNVVLLIMSKKVLMILSKEIITDPRVYKEALTLVNNGYEVRVLCWNRNNSPIPEEIVKKIQVYRLKNTFFMRILSHDLLRNPLWWWLAFKKGISLFEHGFNFDVVHCHDLDTLITGILLKKRFGVKLVYDAHEIFGFMILRDMPKLIVRSVFFMEKVLVKKVDEVITVNIPLNEYFSKLTDAQITIVMNCKDLVIENYTPPQHDVFTISYIGVLNKARLFPDLVDIIGNIDNVKFVNLQFTDIFGLLRQTQTCCD